MIVYRTLRALALAIRWLQVRLYRMADGVWAFAQRLGFSALSLADVAKGAAAKSLAAQEDRAYKALDTAKRNTEAVIESMLRVEDNLEEALEEVLETNAEQRARIFTEVI